MPIYDFEWKTRGKVELVGRGGFGYGPVMKALQDTAVEYLRKAWASDRVGVDIYPALLPDLVCGVDRRIIAARMDLGTHLVTLTRKFGPMPFALTGYFLGMEILNFDPTKEYHQRAQAEIDKVISFFRDDLDRGHKASHQTPAGLVLPLPRNKGFRDLVRRVENQDI